MLIKKGKEDVGFQMKMLIIIRSNHTENLHLIIARSLLGSSPKGRSGLQEADELAPGI